MSLDRVQEMARHLPRRVGNDIVDYARSVRDAAPAILREAGLDNDPELSDQLVFLAGVRKLHAICSAAYWILDASLARLERAGATTVKLGSETLSRGCDEWAQTRGLLVALEGMLGEAGLLDLVSVRSYSDLARRLRDGR
jgi:hypothetical protein